MRKITVMVAIGALSIALAGCGKQASGPGASGSDGSVAEPTMAPAADKLMEDARAVFKPIPLNPPKLAGNDATPDKLALGKMLYFDPRLSASHAISCASCHAIGLGGADNEFDLDRPPLAARRSQRADGVQRRLQRGGVLGREGKGPV